jgi:hypothetical protein
MEFREAMAEDTLHLRRQVRPDREFDDEIFGVALRQLDDLLQASGGRRITEFGLPAPGGVAAGAGR